MLALTACGRLGFGDAELPTAVDGGSALRIHDEDGDGIPDDEDPCPQFAGATDRAEIGKVQIGSACDPHLDSEQRIAFLAFGDSSLPADWIASFVSPDHVNYQWQMVGDAATIDLQAGDAALLTMAMPSNCKQLMVETEVTVTKMAPNVDGAPSQRDVGLVNDYEIADPHADTGWWFGALSDSVELGPTTFAMAYIQDDIAEGDYQSTETVPDLSAPAGATYHLRYTQGEIPGQWRHALIDLATCPATALTPCVNALSLATEPALDDPAFAVSPDLFGDRLGIRARGTQAQFKYVLVLGGHCS
jgi:hypothetical protein